MKTASRRRVDNFVFSWKIPLLFALLEGLTHFGSVQGDSDAYVSMVKIFRGASTPADQATLQWHGMLRPVVPMLAVPFSYVMSYEYAIAAVNVGFFLLGTTFMYQFCAKASADKRVGFISAILYASAYPNLVYGAAVLTDGPGYAMLIVLLYSVVFVLERDGSLRVSLLVGLVFALGVLTKETNFIALAFLVLYFLVTRNVLKPRNFLIVVILALLIPLAWSFVVGTSYLSFYGQGLSYATPGYKGILAHPRMALVQAFNAFNFVLPFAFLAAFLVKDQLFKLTVEMLAAAASLLLVWPTYPEARLLFIVYPAILVLGAFGISQASAVLSRRPWFGRLSQNQWLLLVILFIVLFTNAVTFRHYFGTPLSPAPKICCD